jgi:hypothetical protein
MPSPERPIPAESAHRWRLRVAALAFGLALSGVVLEVAARSTGVEERWLVEMAYLNMADHMLSQGSDDLDLHHELKPGAHLSDTPPHYDGENAFWSRPRVVTINALGHRDALDRTVDKGDDVFRIVCVGGSNTYGASVSDHETWPVRLEEELTARTGRDIEVWNLGVSSYVLQQKLAMARRAIERYSPDLVLVQLHNRGPRAIFPHNEWSEIHGRYLDDPRLFREVFLYVPRQASLAGRLFDASAAWRLLVLFRNRRARAEPGPHQAASQAHAARLESRLQPDYEAFVRDEAGAIPVVALLSIDLADEPWLEGSWPYIPLPQQADLPDRPDARHEHPGEGMYRWYGARIADYLLAAGCLDGTCDVPPAWWGDVDLSPAQAPPSEAPAAAGPDGR